MAAGKITLDWHQLMEQSSGTATHWLVAAREALKGNEGKQDDLAIELAKVAALDFLAMSIAVAADKIVEALEK